MYVRLQSLIFTALIAFASTSFGQVPAPLQSTAPLQSFQGNATQTTAPFQVNDSWEIRWNAVRSVNVSVLGPDGAIVAGAAGTRGALYVPKGGNFHLQIDYEAPPQMGTPDQAPESNHSPTPFENTVNGNNGGNNGSGNNAAPGQTPPGMPPGYAAMMNRPYTVEVVQVSAATAATQGGYAMMPNFKLPAGATPGAMSSAVPPPPMSPPGTPGKLTEDQARAVVLIKGDKAEGTGFMVKTPDGPVVITNIHVIANNPNLKITTNTGALVTVVSQKCASDRDLAMLAIQDNGYNYLEMAPDISKVVQPGDEVITPGNSQGGEVMLNTTGTVLGVGPERVEISNPIFHGNSGGPVFHTKSGKVLGVVTEAEKVDLSNDLDKASFASRNSAIAASMRYFALRLDTVTQWIAIDPAVFGVETKFLDQFEDQSRRLDAYLNASDNSNNPNGASQNDAKIYLDDEKIMRAENNYQSSANGGDTAQHLEALRSLLFDLQGVSDINVTQIQNMNAFYPFDRDRARDEMAYRKALKDELDELGSHIERLSHMPRSNN
jgi:S1-C subfamily serine protease